jgi:mRNA-degrading endonuclease toxin of MazEF toxin-antitoxin module
LAARSIALLLFQFHTRKVANPNGLSQLAKVSGSEVINIKQLRAVDISRLSQRQGALAAQDQDEIKRALCLVFDI